MKLKTYIKGIIIGSVDIIPGVSGGTLALILGVYQELVESIKNFRLKPIISYIIWRMKGSSEDQREEVQGNLKELNLSFLIPILAGILTALILGSFFIPKLMENYPSLTKGFFFGLIIGSFYIPLSHASETLDRTLYFKEKLFAFVFFILGASCGFFATDPNQHKAIHVEWRAVNIKKGETFADVIHRNPSSLPIYEIFWDKRNSNLQKKIHNSSPQLFEKLKEFVDSNEKTLSVEKKTLKAASTYFQEVVFQEETQISIPVLSYFSIFIIGGIAVCAMILPGISGSYLLLILGGYFFILNALNGLVMGITKGAIYQQSILILILFVIGAACGLALFSRLLSFLLHQFLIPTMGFLSGMMIGCLRGIWPFQERINNQLINIVPFISKNYHHSTNELTYVITFAIIGAIIVNIIIWTAKKNKNN